MRIVIVQVFVIIAFAGVSLALDSKAQEVLDKKISLEITNKSFAHVLNRLEKVTDVKFIYSPEVIKGEQKVSIHASDESFNTVLEHLLRPLNLTYEVVGKQIVVRRPGPTGYTAAEPINMAVLSISGIVTGDQGEPLPGVNIVLKGSTIGASTNADGRYTIVTPNGTGILVFSFIGYVTEEVAINDRTIVDMVLLPDIQSLSEVVVTALGIEKEQKRVGYSVSQVKGEELQTTREPSFINSLTGKVAGVVVQSPPNGPGGSSRVLIRGNATFGSNNQPLYVIDGVPIDNTYRGGDPNQGGSGFSWGGTDPGDGLSNLNPDDIESMSVLKGVGAAALYGNRAQRGVILITTKKGKKNQGLGVAFNSNTVIETMVPYTQADLQDTYGRGLDNALFPNVPDSYLNAMSWGPKFGSVATFLDFDGQTRPFVFQSMKDNFKRYFDTGVSTTNSLAFSGGSEKSTYRLSLSQTSNKSPLPNTKFERYNVVFRGTSELGTKLHLDYKVDASRTDHDQNLLGSDDRGGIGHVFSRLSNTTDIRTLAEKDANGGYIYQYKNPYVAREKVRASDRRDRIITSMNLKYDITSYLHATVQGGVDVSNTANQFVVFPNNRNDNTGILRKANQTIEEDNLMGFLSFDKSVGDFSVNVTAGLATRYYKFTTLGVSGRDFVVPNLVDLSNVRIEGANSGPTQQKKVNSIFGSAQFGYKDFLFLEVTGRNDWSSALTSIRQGAYDNTLFYPSANLSYVFTEHFTVAPTVLTSGKLRVAAGQVGNDLDPHLTDLTFSIDPTVNGVPNAQLTGSTLPPTNIKPESTSEIEVGTQLSFLENRLNVDFAWYNKTTKDFLLSSNVSASNGFTSVFINAGSMRNRGLELLVSGTPVKKADFSWDVSLNLARNKNKVLALTDELEKTGVNHLSNVSSFVGDPFASIYGTTVRKGPNGEDVYRSVDTNNDGTPDAVVYESGQVTYDAEGKPVKDANGSIIVNNNAYLGNGNPKLTGGLTNTFRYKGISLSFLIDGQFGGQIYSTSHRWATFFGNAIETVKGREGDYVPTGLINTGTADNPTYTANTLPFSPFQQYNSNNITELNVFDNSFIKLRQIALGFNVPSALVKKLSLKSATFSLIARNLFYLRKDVPIIDPNSGDSIGSGFGFESAALPASRTYGFNLNLQF